MSETVKNQAAIIQNLMDAGGDDVLIQEYMVLLQAGKVERGLQLLSAHRASLLHTIHEQQRKIDCLDYLVFMTKKHMKEGV